MIRQHVLLLVIFLAACGTAEPTPTPYPAPEFVSEAGMITYYQMTMADGTPLQYGVMLPNNFVEGEMYPVLLAFPPGPQTKAMVEAGMGYWGAEGQARGWVIVSPIAPGGTLFFQGSEQYLPEFVQRIEAIYPPEGGKLHVAGVSNGGISAFRIAIMMPEKFASITAVLGFPQTSDFDKLDTLTNIPITMYVGENDTSWVERMTATEAELQRLGGQVSLTIVPNEGHVIQNLTGAELYDVLDSYRGEIGD
jgi:dipeptidyl aminopeptidase/acylaminoacyl peptidase